jgi:hypothetical protein
VANDKLYIHEFIDIIGHNRAHYMHHMLANWSPEGQEQRNQLCYGVWAVLGSTGRWPETVNIWEHDGWDGLAASFAVETVGPGAQDPALEKWWAKAAELRRGGVDRILEPAPWTRTITELCAAGVTGECYVHELVRVRAGAARDFLDEVRDRYVPIAAANAWELAGAWRTAMANDDECILIWAIPKWSQWAAFEQAHQRESEVQAWRAGLHDVVERWERFVMTDAPLSPFKTRRQPTRADRTDWKT